MKLIYINNIIYIADDIEKYRKGSYDCLVCDIKEERARTTLTITICPESLYDDLPEIFAEAQKKFKNSIYIANDASIKTINYISGTVTQVRSERNTRVKAQFEAEDNLLADKIKDIKEKKELFDLGLVDEDEWNEKKAEYAPLKAKHKAAKDKKNKYVV